MIVVEALFLEALTLGHSTLIIMAMSYSWLLLFHTLSIRLPSGNQPWLSGQSPIYFGKFPSELNLVRILRDTNPWPRSQWPAHT